MTKEEAVGTVASLGIREFGVYNGSLADSWKPFLSGDDSEKFPVKLVAALNNNDSVKALLEVIRSNPEKVLDGMEIAGYLLGAEEMILYLPEAETALKAELEASAADRGIRIVNDDFVDRRCFEGCAIHHIATMAALADGFAGSYAPGVFAAVRKNGVTGELKKIPYGTKVSDIIGTEQGEIKAVQIGSKLYDASALELKIDENFPMGNGVITVFDKTACMIDEAEKRLYESRKMGCGKCTFCREGLLQLQSFVKDITKGKGKNEYLPLLQEIGEALPYSTMCSIGQTGADFLTGTLTRFEAEYDGHIRKKACAAEVCTAFVSIYIDPELCTGCGDCMDVCPEDCIEGKSGFIHMIDDLDCTKCGKCMEVCEEGAVKKTAGRVPKLPDRLTKCGKFKKR